MMTSPERIAHYREQSRHFLDLVDDELARGELEEASNKLWGAAAHAVKAVAEFIQALESLPPPQTTP